MAVGDQENFRISLFLWGTGHVVCIPPSNSRINPRGDAVSGIMGGIICPVFPSVPACGWCSDRAGAGERVHTLRKHVFPDLMHWEAGVLMPLLFPLSRCFQHKENQHE